MPYNLTELASAANPVDWFQISNGYAENMMGLFLIMLIGVALFFTLRRDNTTKTSVVVTMFALLILSTLFRLMQIVDMRVVGVILVLFIGSFIFMVNND